MMKTSLIVVAGLGVALTACSPSRKELMAELDQVKADLTTAQGSIKTLGQQVAELEKDIATKNAQIESLETKLAANAAELEELRAAKAEREKELETYRQLFAKLKQDGIVTLNEISKALASLNDRDFLVAGHTDNVPIRTARYRNNWELSTERAVVVVEHMISQGFPSEHIGAAGYAEVDPVAGNEDETGRAQNRRIEIILMPNLGELKGIREMVEGGGSGGSEG